MQRERAFSGVQPTGRLHLGNYLGALKQWVAHQHERENLFCVVDLHALTIPEAIEPAALREASRRVAATYFAAGIDPKVAPVFIQSWVPQHAQLAWDLTCVTPLGWLERMTQFKSKSEGRETIGHGLLAYPVLMAADILLYDTTIVPVGEDQTQHVELARDIALRFNRMFGETFTVPKLALPPAGARVMGFDDATVKMSKSLATTRPAHAVFLDDPPKKIKKTIMRAVTDSGCDYNPETASAGVRNLMGVLSALTGESVAQIAQRFEGQGYGYLKAEVADAVVAELEPMQAEFLRYTSDPATLDARLTEGAERVQEIAQATLSRVHRALGIGAQIGGPS